MKLEISRCTGLRFVRTFQPVGEQRMTEKTTVGSVPPTRSSIPSNTIFIGQKPIMSYVTAIVMQFNSGSKELTVKARDRVISQAVDVVEVCCRRSSPAHSTSRTSRSAPKCWVKRANQEMFPRSRSNSRRRKAPDLVDQISASSSSK